METDLNLKVDTGRIQSAVLAVIRPAVEEALASYDIRGAIVRQLTTERPKEKGREQDYWLMSRYLSFGPSESEDIGSLLDRMVTEEIQTIAKEYVASNIRMQREEIEEAFRKMMNGSTNRLVRSLAQAAENALKDDWGFELDVKVSHTVAEK